MRHPGHGPYIACTLALLCFQKPVKTIFPPILFSLFLACGDDSTVGAASQSSGDASSESDPDPGESSTSGGSTLDGLTLNELRHEYTCVDGCDGYRSDDRFELTVTSDTQREIEIRLYDFTTTGETLVQPSEPLTVALKTLEAGVSTTIPLTIDDPVKCRTTVGWGDKPISILLSIDGDVFEFDGLSVGSSAAEGEC